MKRLLMLFAVTGLAAGCEAKFKDLRPEGSSTGTTDPYADGGFGDIKDPLAGDTGSGGSDVDVVETDAVESDVPQADAAMMDAGDRLAAQGKFKPRDYNGEGTASLYELAGGGWELRLGKDFKTESVPGPVVVLAKEKTLGKKLKPKRGDVDLGKLKSDSGASTYKLPFPPGPRRVVFIYCKPFGLEVSRAILQDQ